MLITLRTLKISGWSTFILKFDFILLNKRIIFSQNLISKRNFNNDSVISTKDCKNVVFFGSDDFSLPTFQRVISTFDPSSVLTVISNHNNLVGKYVKKNGLKSSLWEDFKREDSMFDIGIVASFGHLIPSQIIDRCKMGILNVHGSILPRWRGASPIPHSLIYGDSTSGISIMKIKPHKFDVGEILLTSSIEIPKHIRNPEFRNIMADLGANTLQTVLNNMSHYFSLAVPQSNENTTNAPRLTKEIANIDWKQKNSIEIYNLFRGLYGIYKLRTSFSGKIVDIDCVGLILNEKKSEKSEIYYNEVNKSMSSGKNTSFSEILDFSKFYKPSPVKNDLLIPEDLKQSAQPGQIYFTNNLICVKCGDGHYENLTKDEDQDEYINWIFIEKIKIGTKWMSALDFKNGFLSKEKNKINFFEEIKN